MALEHGLQSSDWQMVHALSSLMIRVHPAGPVPRPWGRIRRSLTEVSFDLSRLGSYLRACDPRRKSERFYAFVDRGKHGKSPAPTAIVPFLQIRVVFNDIFRYFCPASPSRSSGISYVSSSGSPRETSAGRVRWAYLRETDAMICVSVQYMLLFSKRRPCVNATALPAARLGSPERLGLDGASISCQLKDATC